MKLSIIYRLIQLGFVPMKTNIIPLATESIEALEYSSNSNDGEKIVHILVSNSLAKDGDYFVRLDKTCGKSTNEKFYHKVIETYLEENQVMNYIEDKLNITKTNLGGNN